MYRKKIRKWIRSQHNIVKLPASSSIARWLPSGVVINEQDTLPMFKLLALRCHLFICKVCRLFQQQSAGLNKALKKNEEAKKLTLSLEKKEAMSKLLNELDQ
ncbi:hypothetical protein EMGBS15_15620 [Filimonas sp.]|nr:hypothetical protein EMGBS15_15620 [Filimonas sp.]